MALTETSDPLTAFSPQRGVSHPAQILSKIKNFAISVTPELRGAAAKCYEEGKRQHRWQGCSWREAQEISVLQCHLVGIAASRCRPRTPKQEFFQPTKHSFNTFARKASATTVVSRCFPPIETWHWNAETSDFEASTGQEELCTTRKLPKPDSASSHTMETALK